MATEGKRASPGSILLACAALLLPSALVSGTDPLVRLNTPRGPVFMPQVALGVWELNSTEVDTAIKFGLEVGFKHVDTANDYYNQEAVGQAIRAYGSRRGVFLTTKVPGCKAKDPAACKGETAKAMEEDLELLGFDQVDLVLVHFPPRPFPYSPADCERARAQWEALEEAYAANKTRAVGVSNYCPSVIECIAPSDAAPRKGAVVPAVNQVQFHVGMGTDPGGIASYCARRGILLQAYSPLGDGRSRELISGPLVMRIGAENGRSGVQTALKYVQQLGLALVTKSTSRAHLAQDIDLFNWQLSPQQMLELASATTPAANYSFACTA